MGGDKLTSRDIEEALANYFDWRDKLVIPRVSFGFSLHHEADMLVMSKNGYLTEIEIKVSKADLKQDLKKIPPRHGGKLIKAVYFAVPTGFEDVYNFIDQEYGIIEVKTGKWVHIHRPAKINKQALKLTSELQFRLARLGAIKMWANRFNGKSS